MAGAVALEQGLGLLPGREASADGVVRPGLALYPVGRICIGQMHGRPVDQPSHILGSGTVATEQAVVPQHPQVAGLGGRFVRRFREALGVQNVGLDRERGVGRGKLVTLGGAEERYQELCGQCWKGRLCVTSSGEAFPCVFARATQLGNVKSGLVGIMRTVRLTDFRRKLRTLNECTSKESTTAAPGVRNMAWAPLRAQCNPDDCGPGSCNPAAACNPDDCGPGSCNPAAHRSAAIGALSALALVIMLATGSAVEGGRQPGQRDSPRPLPEHIVAAWKEAGASVCWAVANQSGFIGFVPEENSAPGALPAFRFVRWQADHPARLPDPATAFGLDLSDTRVTDAGLKELAGLRSLQLLNLHNTQVTDAGLKELIRLPKLANPEP
jgi:hypothetical protein